MGTYGFGLRLFRGGEQRVEAATTGGGVMFRPTVIGLLCIAIGFVVWIFEAIADMMNPGEIVLDNATPMSLLGEAYLSWVDAITWLPLHQAVDYLANAPVFILCIALGVIVLLMGMIFR